jgi:hypothetical protein
VKLLGDQSVGGDMGGAFGAPRQLIPALVCSALLWSPAWAELPTLDEPPNYGHAVWIQQLQSLPDLEPGEQVFALLDLTHFAPKSGNPTHAFRSIRVFMGSRR